MSKSYLGKQLLKEDITTNVPTSSSFPELLLLSMMLYDIEYPFGQLGSAILAVFFPDFLPSLLFFGGGCLKRKPQGCASRLCLAIAKTLMYYQHCFSHNTTCRPITILFLYHQIGKLVDSGYTLLVDL